MHHRTREEQVRAEISKDEAIRRIEKYGAEYDPDLSMDAWDQLLACEAVAESTPVRDNYFQNKEENGANENSSVQWSVNDTYKRTVNFELTEDKQKVFEKLKECTHRTSRFELAKLLEEFFSGCNTQEGHWLYIAQTYTPRVICWNLNYMIKLHISGRRVFKNWAAYFTETIKLRKKRKCL